MRAETKIGADKVAAQLSAMEARLAVLEPSPVDEGGGDDEERQSQVIASGWAKEESEANVVESIRKFLNTNDLNAKVSSVACFTDPSAFGVILFASPARAKAFLRNLSKTKNFSIDGDRILRFSRNRTLQQRAEDKRLGMLKHEISKLPGMELRDIKIK